MAAFFPPAVYRLSANRIINASDATMSGKWIMLKRPFMNPQGVTVSDKCFDLPKAHQTERELSFSSKICFLLGKI